MNNEAGNLVIKEILLKQLQLLHEKSAECTDNHLVEFTELMLSIARHIDVPEVNYWSGGGGGD